MTAPDKLQASLQRAERLAAKAKAKIEHRTRMQEDRIYRESEKTAARLDRYAWLMETVTPDVSLACKTLAAGIRASAAQKDTR